MRTPTRSPTPCASRSRHCANASANARSSPPCPAPGTKSTPELRGKAVDRAPGLSVRLKLTFSYAGFLLVAGALLLAATWVYLTRVSHVGLILEPSYERVVLREFAPTAAIVMAFLLVFGLVGGWLLAGRMLGPLDCITDATRIAANGSLSHRIRLPGRRDELRELADAFDAMLARLEAHVAEQQRFAVNASHELRTPLAITQTLLDVAATIKTAATTSSSTASISSPPERSTSPKPCSCSAAPTSGPSSENTPTCRSWPKKPPKRSSPSRKNAAPPSRPPATRPPPSAHPPSCCR